MRALLAELNANGCILQGKEKVAEEILAKHLENVPKHIPFNGKMIASEFTDALTGVKPELFAETPDDAA